MVDLARRSPVSEQTAAFLSHRLREHARANGWPENVAASLGVEHHNGHFRPTYPDHLADDILRLEYGTENEPPSATLRQFANRMEGMAGHMHADEMMQYLDASGVI